jgi:hypothetical protein
MDEIFISVPNKDLADQRVSNLSRVKQCSVKQTLRFKYSDIDKIPGCLEAIKEEVKKACPTVITDRSRPFRAHISRYNPDHIRADVDFRFRLKPLGGKDIVLSFLFIYHLPDIMVTDTNTRLFSSPVQSNFMVGKDAFFINRQKVLLIIAKVVKEHGMEFAVVDVNAISRAVQAFVGEEDKDVHQWSHE